MQLTVTVGGRYNHATIKLTDNTGLFPGLNATNKYERFNPMVGANYKLLPGMSLYGGYSESNRAPTPAELAAPSRSSRASSRASSPTIRRWSRWSGARPRLGLRGQGSNLGGRYTWSAGLFRTLASDDILPITDNNRIFFVNAGDTLRQGVELSATYETRKWNVYANYAFVDATLDTCDQPSGECAFLQAGDRLPGIPRHRFKAGVEYWVTSKWKVGTDLVAASDSPFFPNEVRTHGSTIPRRLRARRYEHVLRHHRERPDLWPREEPVQLEVRSLRHILRSRRGEPRSIRPWAGPASAIRAPSRRAMPFAAYGGVKVKY